MAAQPPGSRLTTLRVATHDQQVAQFEGQLPVCRDVVGVFYSPNRQDIKEFWEEGVISKTVGRFIYYWVGSMNTKDINQLTPRYTENVTKVPMEVLCNEFDIPAPPIPIIEMRTSNRKIKNAETFGPNPKRKRYLLISERNLAQGEVL